MYSKLKYLSFLSCLVYAGCLSSCSSDLLDKIDDHNGAEVSFGVSAGSRASQTTSFNNFAVYGDMKLPGNAPTVVFNKTEVVNNGGVWTYQGTQYWFPNHEHSFVAVNPLSVLEADNNPTYSDSKLTFTYSLPISDGNFVNESEIKDIVAATHRRLYNENDVAGVTVLSFSHLLSLINFSVELTEPSTRSEECFKIHKLEMSGFGTKATINVEPAPLQSNNQTNDSQIEIVTAKGNGSLEINFDEPIEVINGAAAVKMFDSNNAIIMLPQTFAANEEVKITLTYSANDGTETTEVSTSLSSFTWEWGRSYNYRIKLELEQKEVNMVISNATIAPWNLVDDLDKVDAR